MSQTSPCPRCQRPRRLAEPCSVCGAPPAPPPGPPSSVAPGLDVWQACAQLLERDPLANPVASFNLERGAALGQGGMGVVYAVHDRRADRPAALKLLRDPHASEEAQRRFLREARITAHLDHPAIPPVYDVGRAQGGQLYMLMRRVRGETLTARLRDHHERGAPAAGLRELTGALVKVAEAIAYAHSEGVLHRDVKPSNIMIGAFGEVLLMDWGIARDRRESVIDDQALREALDTELDELERRAEAAAAEGFTLTGASLGTPGYMPPEQIEGGVIDARADVFALGVTLALLLRRRPPIAGDNALQKLKATLTAAIDPPGPTPCAPKELCWIAAQALEPDREDRCESAPLFAARLEAWLAGSEVPGYPYRLPERALRAARRYPARLLVGLMGSLLLALTSLLLQARERARAQGAALMIAEAGEATAKGAATRAAQVTKALNTAADLARRGGSLSAVTKALERALDLSERAAPSLLAAARIYEQASRKEAARTLLEEAAERHPPAYEALYMLHTLALGGRSFGYTEPLDRLMKRARARGDENEYTLLSQGLDAHEGGDLPTALALFDRALARTPRFKEGLICRAQVLWDSGDEAGAERAIARALAIDPEFTHAYHLRAEILTARGAYPAALADYDRLIALDPNDAPAFNNRGNARKATGDLEGAIEDYDRAIALDPNGASAFNNRGNARQDTGDLEGAIADYDRAIASDPKDATAFNNRGIARKATGDLEGAIADYGRAIALDPSDAKAFNNRGNARRATGDLEGAIADYGRAIALDPNHAKAFNNRGKARSATGDLEGAIADYGRAIALDPNHAKAFNNRGNARSATGDLEGAIADYDRAIALDPSYAPAFNNRGIARRATSDLEGAIADYDRAISLDPKDARALRNKAIARKAQGDLEGAIADYDRAIALDPKNARALRNKALAHRATSESAGSPAGDDQALSHDRRHLQPLVDRAIARAESGDLKGARADYDRAIAAFDRNLSQPGVASLLAALLTNRGVLRRAQRDLDGALADFDRAIALAPEDPDFYANRGLLQLERGARAAALVDLRRALALTRDASEAKALRARIATLEAEGAFGREP